MKSFDLKSMVRPNILKLAPYSSARDEFSGSEGIFLDANENPYGTYNRYPDPQQRALKNKLAKLKEVAIDNILIGNGSDEVIDLIFRLFCRPGEDRIIVCPPTYGMYEVSAGINDVEVVEVPLTTDFQLDIDGILQQQAKVVFICSPNNPTGNLLQDVERLLREFNGIVVVDEAYIDFCIEQSWVSAISRYPQLIVTQTFSKAWGLAGARVGVAYADKAIIGLMNKIKPPYNVSELNQREALRTVSNKLEYNTTIAEILQQREWLRQQLEQMSMVVKIYPSDANFLLVEVTDANRLYSSLIDQSIITRNRHSQINQCLRITVGSTDENKALIEEMQRIELQSVL